LLAYLRLIAVPMDSVACARVLGMPDWGFQPADLVRLAERARQSHAALSVALEANLNEPPFAKPGTQAEDLVAFLKELRRRAWQVPTTVLFEELLAGLGVAPMETDADAWHLKRFAKFIRDWEKKSDGKKLRDFIEYFDFFLEAGGEICQEEDPPDDAVQLMTVHAAKGLEFPHVFVIEMGSKDFPSGQRRPIFEFPAQLMKEEQPQGDFHIQEERRLFYVALTRARRMLTLSTVVNNKKRWSQFLDDILSDAKIQAGDTQRLAPKVIVPPEEDMVGPASADPAQPLLFGPTSAAARVYSRVALWAKAYHPPLPEPLRLSASSIDVYDRCPMKYMFQSVWKISGRAAATMTFGSVMHSTIREFAAEVHKGRRIPFEEVSGIYDREWRSVGYSDDYQEEEYRAAGREQLQAFCAEYVKSPPDVLRQEARFELPLENNVVVNGRIDQINRIKGRKVEIVDYKTGNPLDAKAAKKSLQLSLYALAAREVLELDPVRLVFYNLRSNEAIVGERDAKALKKARESVSEVADLIRAGEFPAKVGFFCRDCDYRLLCPAHEQLVSIRPAGTALARIPI
jgi:DNA helicase II / ATP-dependent DNA helicase PcrA